MDETRDIMVVDEHDKANVLNSYFTKQSTIDDSANSLPDDINQIKDNSLDSITITPVEVLVSIDNMAQNGKNSYVIFVRFLPYCSYSPLRKSSFSPHFFPHFKNDAFQPFLKFFPRNLQKHRPKIEKDFFPFFPYPYLIKTSFFTYKKIAAFHSIFKIY